MRPGLIIACVVLGLSTVAWGVTEWLKGSEQDPPPAVRTEGMTAGEELDLLLGNVAPTGYGATPHGMTIARRNGGAVITLPDGAEIVLTPPEGHVLDDRFVVLGPAAGGFILTTPAGRTLYYSFAHAGRRLGPPEDADPAAFYAGIAEVIREDGVLPFLDSMLPVTRVSGAAGGVFYCLLREDGMRFHGATRFVGPLSVTAMTAGGCAPGDDGLDRRLSLAERTIGEGAGR